MYIAGSFTEGNDFYDFLFVALEDEAFLKKGSTLNHIAVRKAKIYTILALLSAIGLKESIK